MSLVLMLLALGWTQGLQAKTVYIKPNSNWLQDGARFALYMYGTGDAEWADFAVVDADNNIYKATFNDSQTNMIFVRMNGKTTENNWDNKWNQSDNLAAPSADNLLYTITEGRWGKDSDGNENGKIADDDGLSTEPYTEPVAGEAYLADFNTAITTSVHDFSVAKNWGHIVGVYEDPDGYDGYMSYSYSTTDGIDGTGTLLAYRQYAENQFKDGDDCYDLLVTPLVSGTITLYVKASSSATTNYPAYVEFYKLNSNGTERGVLIQRFTADDFTASDIEGWYTVTINLDEEQRIGIRGQYVYMDNFTATSATIIDEKKLVINSVSVVSGNTPVICNQNEDGSANVTANVTITNTGDVDLAVGDENYSLAFVWKTYHGSAVNTYDNVKFDIPENLAKGEQKTITVSFNIPSDVVSAIFSDMSRGFFYLKVKENISGTTSSAQLQCQLKEYASKFIFDKEGTSYNSSSSATTTPIDFGKVAGEVEPVKYEIYNSGSAPLTINSFTLPEGFSSDAPAGEFTVAGGEKKVITISFTATEPRIYNGNLTIVYTNFGKEQATYTLGISSTIVDASKNLITFSNSDNTNGQFPAGSIHSDYVYISSADDNYYLVSTSTVTKFITPLLTAEAGESFTFDAWYSGYSPDNGTAYVTVFSSTDRINWTQIAKQTYSSGISSTAKTFYATIEKAGNYYLAFEIGSVTRLDNIYGLTLAEAPAHDWYLTETANIPTTGKQNSEYKASVKVQNISADADAIETATLYVGGEAVATVENIALAANEKTAAVGTGRNEYSNIVSPATVEITYKPHNFGTFPAYIELKSGDAVVKTDEVEVNIAKEKAESDASLAGSTTGTSGTIVAPYYNHSGSESLLTAQILESMGITAGAKISRIYVNGYNTSGETTHTTKVWMGNTSATELSSPFTAYDVDANAEGLTKIMDEDHVYPKIGTSSEHAPLLDIKLNEPFVYNGGSIRIIAKADVVTTYKSINFEKSNISGYCQAYSYDGASGSYTAANLPAFHFELVFEPKTLSGTVTDGENAVEGAKVTIRNNENDIEYFATTDAEGAYTIDVVRDQLTYTATVTADGYETLTDETVLNFTEGSQTKDFVLTKEGAFKLAYDNSWTGKAGLKNWKNSVDMTVENAQVGDIIRVAYNYETTMLRFSNTQNWNDIYVYAWDANENALTAAWHGDKMENFSTNDYGEKVYDIYIPEGAAGVVISNGDEQQTANITDLTQLGYYVTSDQRDGEGHFVAIPWPDNNVQLQLQDAEGNLINGTEQTNIPSGENSVDIMITNDILAQLANNAVVSLKGENATITGISLIEKEPISVTISASQYATLYYQNVNLTIPEGVTAYAAVKNGNSIELNEIADVIPAGVPVVINGDAGTYDFQIAAEANKFTGENDLTGTEEDVKDEEAGYKYYVLCWKDSSKSAVGFYFQSGSNGAYAQVKAHQAYMKINASEAPAKGFDIFINGDATGIDSIELSTLTDNDKVYTLSGVRVNANRVAKGVYIVNGQKVVIK